MRSRQTRTIRANVLHGRTPDGLLDYKEFFEWLAELPRSLTRTEINRELVLAIERVLVDGPFFHFRFISGNPQEIPLLYDDRTGETAEAATPEGTWLASPTRVSIIPEDRIAVVEGRRNGVSATNLERYFSAVAREAGFSDRLQIDVNPLPSPSFEQELDQLVRIREAALVVNRPNSDWDDANDVLSELADESGGQKAQVVISAARGQSLDKSNGIVGLIRAHLSRPLSNLRNLRVTGRKQGENTDRTLSLEKHQLQSPVSLDPRAPQFVQDQLVFDSSKALAEVAIGTVRQSSGEPGPTS